MPGAIRTTSEIASSVTYRGESNHSIPVSGPLRTDDADLPIDPYVLGAWLGDGHSNGGEFTFADEEIAARIESAGFQIEKRGNRYRWQAFGLRPLLRAAGVLGDKHIPSIYLRASIAQRTALLQGLMDTDGTVDINGKCEFCSTSAVLSAQVLELITSLGIKATRSDGIAKLYGRDCGPKYRIHFFRPGLNVFHITRKAARLRAAGEARSEINRTRYITKVEPCESVPVRCIKVDSPSSLFLASPAMIPTHNSRTGSERVLRLLGDCSSSASRYQ
jgi:intein/homing endonuclease